MNDVVVGRRAGPLGGPLVDVEPVPLADAARITLDSVRVAWAADRRGLAGAVLLNAAASSADLVQLVVSRRALEAVFAGSQLRSQLPRLALIGGFTVASALGQSAAETLLARTGQASMRRAERRVLDAVGALELPDVEDPAFQDQLQRAFIGTGRHADLLRQSFLLPPAVAAAASAIAAMTTRDRLLVLLALGGGVGQWALTRGIQDPRRVAGMRSREGREAVLLRHLLTGTTAAHEVRAFGAGTVLRRRYDEVSERADRAQRDVARHNARTSATANLAARAAGAPAGARVVLQVALGGEPVATAVARGVAARRLNRAFQRVVLTVAGMRRTAGLVEDYRSFGHTVPRRRGQLAPNRDFDRIVFDNVSFAYPGRAAPVLDGVDLEIHRGEVVALVGENGCGKTTLAKLLCDLYRPTGGTIRWDDVDVATCDPEAVRAHIAMVFQDFVRYPLTAADNIGIGLPSRLGDRDAIIAAARQAGADAVIADLPNGYDTLLARHLGGVELSVGQWQRIALARAFLRDAPLVVLDEPTAALDPRAERDLFETVASLYRSRSALLISHRLSSVRFADRICVLAGGRITESGTHHELVKAGGTYAELFELQARAYR